MPDELTAEEAEAIRRWCVSDEGQRCIQGILDEIDMANRVLRLRRMKKFPVLRVVAGNNVDNQ